jgi:hypothetical protein
MSKSCQSVQFRLFREVTYTITFDTNERRICYFTIPDLQILSVPCKLLCISLQFPVPKLNCCRSRWPRGLRRRSAGTLLLRLRVWIPPWAWISVGCECCVLSSRGLYNGLITRPEESYRLWCVVVCDLNEEVLAHRGLLRGKKLNS